MTEKKPINVKHCSACGKNHNEVTPLPLPESEYWCWKWKADSETFTHYFDCPNAHIRVYIAYTGDERIEANMTDPLTAPGPNGDGGFIVPSQAPIYGERKAWQRIISNILYSLANTILRMAYAKILQPPIVGYRDFKAEITALFKEQGMIKDGNPEENRT